MAAEGVEAMSLKADQENKNPNFVCVMQRDRKMLMAIVFGMRAFIRRE